MLNVAVTGINAIDNPGPGIGIAKSLKQHREITITGLAYDAMEPGIYMNWLVDKSFLLPNPSQDEEIFLNRISYIKEATGAEVILPSLDAELPIFIQRRNFLDNIGIKTFLPTDEQFKLRGKDKLPEIAERIDIKVPKTLIVYSHEELNEAVEELGFPLMVKGLFYKAYKALNITEAVNYFDTIVSEWGYPIILQEVIKGEEVNLVGVGDGEGDHLGMVAIKKLWRTNLGKIWTGVTIRNEKLFSYAESFLKEFKWRGAFEFECILSNNELYLIEINPRFPAWIYFATGVGVNLPWRLLKSALGEDVEREWNYPSGKLYIRFTDDIVTDISEFQSIVMKGEK